MLGILVDAPRIAVLYLCCRPSLRYVAHQAALWVEGVIAAILEVCVVQQACQVFRSGAEGNACNSTNTETRVHERDTYADCLVLGARVVNGSRNVALCHRFVPCFGSLCLLDGDDRCRPSCNGNAYSHIIGRVESERRQAAHLNDVETLLNRHSIFCVRSCFGSRISRHVKWPYGSRGALNAKPVQFLYRRGSIAKAASIQDIDVGLKDGALLLCHIIFSSDGRHQVLTPVVGLVVHHTVPLAISNAGVVFRCQRDNLVKSLLSVLCVAKCLLALSCPCIDETLACPEQLDVLVGAGTDRVFDELIVGTTQRRGNARTQSHRPFI